jgi:hypothetical protein
MQVDLYHVVSNSHMAEALFAYVPKDRLIIEGDFFDVGWELYWWQNTYADNIAYRHLTQVSVGDLRRYRELRQRFDSTAHERLYGDRFVAGCRMSGADGASALTARRPVRWPRRRPNTSRKCTGIGTMKRNVGQSTGQWRGGSDPHPSWESPPPSPWHKVIDTWKRRTACR